MDFLFLGGDLRYLYTAEKLSEKYNVKVYGIISDTSIQALLSEEMPKEKVDYLVLPIPFSVDGENVNAPFFPERIPLSLIGDFVKENGVVFSGKTTPYLKKICDENNLTLIDYFQREELAVMNAIPTAEATIQTAVEQTDRMLYKMRVLVTGYGRISRILVKYLLAMGADVTVCARKCEQRLWAEIDGCKSLPLTRLAPCAREFQLIINTVPFEIITRSIINVLDKHCVIIDLASAAGVDFAAAKSAGIKTVWALSLPGKTAPVSAGEIIAETIDNILTERGETNG